MPFFTQTDTHSSHIYAHMHENWELWSQASWQQASWQQAHAACLFHSDFNCRVGGLVWLCTSTICTALHILSPPPPTCLADKDCRNKHLKKNINKNWKHLKVIWYKFFFSLLTSNYFSVSNMPPNTTRDTMHWGMALPLTSCSNKAEGHSSCQCCSQCLAWRTNRGFVLRPAPFSAIPHAPTPLGGPEEICVCVLPYVVTQNVQLLLQLFHFSKTEQTPALTLEPRAHTVHVDSSQIRLLPVFNPTLQFKKYSDSPTVLKLFTKWLPASPADPGFS